MCGTCGCSSDSSMPVKCAPVSPPKSPKPLIKSISADGVEIIWEKAKEYGSALLSVSLNSLSFFKAENTNRDLYCPDINLSPFVQLKNYLPQPFLL